MVTLNISFSSLSHHTRMKDQSKKNLIDMHTLHHSSIALYIVFRNNFHTYTTFYKIGNSNYNLLFSVCLYAKKKIRFLHY